MRAWEKAVDEFVNDWKDKKNVEIIFLTGSYVNGTNGPHSDLDVYVVVGGDNFNPIKGLKNYNGHIVEYNIVPLYGAIDYLGNGIDSGNKSDLRGIMFMKVLFEKGSKSKVLIRKAKKLMKKSFPKVSRRETEHLKYDLWNLMYSTRNLYDLDSPMFYHSYSLLLFRLIRNYGKFLGIESFSLAKYYSYLKYSSFRKRYHLSQHKDKVFARKMIRCIEEKDKKRMFMLVQDTVDYVLEKMGGFDENNWEIKRY